MNQGTLQSLLVEDADKKRLEELRAFVIYHNHRYHTLDAPEITDDEYNAAFLRLEERHPEWRSPDSPTNRIGGQVLSSLETKAHTRRMYSLDNVFDAEEWQGFLKRLDNAQAGLEQDRKSVSMLFGVIRKWTASPLSLCMRTGGLSKH